MPLHHDHDEEAFNGRFIRVVRRHFRDLEHRPGVWEMVQRRVHGPIVAVLAVTDAQEVLLNRIWRVPLGRYVLELPAGLMDRAGEAPEVTAGRELVEETGYAARSLEKLMAGPFNAGLTSDELWIYLGTGAARVAEPEREATEDMTVLLVPMAGLQAFLDEPPPDTLVDLKLYGVIPFLQRRFPAAFGR